jgi:hypothetical protein
MPKVMGLVAAVSLLLTSTAAILATPIAMQRPASAHEDHGHFSAGEPGVLVILRIAERKILEPCRSRSPI